MVASGPLPLPVIPDLIRDPAARRPSRERTPSSKSHSARRRATHPSSSSGLSRGSTHVTAVATEQMLGTGPSMTEECGASANTLNHQIVQIDLQRHSNPLQHIDRTRLLTVLDIRQMRLRNSAAVANSVMVMPRYLRKVRIRLSVSQSS